MIKKVFITGGGGFLGKSICKLLVKKKISCISFSRKHYSELEKIGVECRTGSLDEYSNILRNLDSNCDAIIHTAAQAGIWGHPKELYKTNVVGTKNLIKAAKEKKIKYFVYTSSPSVVFDKRNIRYKNEDLPYAKEHLCEYAKTKRLAESFVLSQNNSDTFVTAALRPHLIWGPEDPHFLPRLIQKSREKKLFFIGNGKNLVDTIYVDNAAQAHLDLLFKMYRSNICSGKAYFIGQEKAVNLPQFINSLLSTANQPSCHKRIPFFLAYSLGFMFENFYSFFKVFHKEPKMTRFLALQLSKSHFFDHSSAKKDFGYYPKISITEGLKLMKNSLKN